MLHNLFQCFTGVSRTIKANGRQNNIYVYKDIFFPTEFPLQAAIVDGGLAGQLTGTIYWTNHTLKYGRKQLRPVRLKTCYNYLDGVHMTLNFSPTDRKNNSNLGFEKNGLTTFCFSFT